ncbi:inositol polyphosphate 5-phosphatase [Rhizophlyctis rosea]|uniref:Inositol polyphosphate 5-phosphatase n=1 Tax=Rhizophlyctis rosea TaxID=64517 RepID=A0AAD5SM58_9FUNG|nr:inositol polyphosphate 5-phosphatase [Rhizophlyctis rosea]
MVSLWERVKAWLGITPASSARTVFPDENGQQQATHDRVLTSETPAEPPSSEARQGRLPAPKAWWRRWGWTRLSRRKRAKLNPVNDEPDKELDRIQSVKTVDHVVKSAELTDNQSDQPLQPIALSKPRAEPLPKTSSPPNTNITTSKADLQILPSIIKTASTYHLQPLDSRPSTASTTRTTSNLLRPSSSTTYTHGREKSSASHHSAFRATIHKSLSDVRQFIKETFTRSRDNLAERGVHLDNKLRVYIGTWNMNGRVSNAFMLLNCSVKYNRSIFNCKTAWEECASPVWMTELHLACGDQEQVATSNFTKETLILVIIPQLPLHSLDPFLGHSTPHPTHPSYQNCHLIVIGTQECLLPLERSVLFPSKTAWEDLLMRHYGDEYELVGTDTMVGLHLAVLAKKEMVSYVEDVQLHHVPTGLSKVVGKIGNKGGIGIGLKFMNTSMLFVNSHLTAGHKRVAERNHDFQKINSELKLFGNREEDKESYGATERHEFVFWFGDLNYRINGTRSIVEALLENNRIEALLGNDQLTLERQKLAAFPHFSEHPITFRPTYKFDVLPVALTMSSPASSPPDIDTALRASNESLPEDVETPYDTSPKMRIPAWTDRIMWKATTAEGEWVGSGNGMEEFVTREMERKEVSGGVDNSRVKCERYDSCVGVTCSDHKPVVGIYVCDIVVPSLSDRHEHGGTVERRFGRGKSGKRKGKGKWRRG